jgi:repressor LexA
MLTKKQYDLLVLIDNKLRTEGVSPSFEEMKNFLGLKSKSGIHRLISSLEERHFIRRLPHKARAIEVIRRPTGSDYDVVSSSGFKTLPLANTDYSTTQIPLYGKIAAGTPIEALRDENEFVSVPNDMLGVGEHYALTVQGDSMVEAGILDGDTVVIQRTNTTENGAIVVALVDGYEVTLKKLFCRKGMIDLVPANKEYKTRSFEADRVSVQGRLVGLMRNY